MSCEGWKTYRLGEAFHFNPKESIPKGTIAKKIAMEKIQPFTRMIDGFEKAPFSGGSKFRNGDTLLARITPCLENGKTAQVRILDESEIGFGSTEFIVIRGKKGVSDSNFIFYFVNSPWFRNIAIRSMVGSSGRQRVQQNVLENIEVALPNLNKQKKIAAILSSLDDKIELNNQINANLEQQAQAIFKSWFVDFEPFQDGEFVDSELGMIPKGWSVTTLNDFCSLIAKGITPKYKENTGEYVIGQKCIRNNKIDLSLAQEHLPRTINERWLHYGDILINSTGTGTLGRVAQVNIIPKNLVVDSHITIIRPRDEHSIDYLGGLLCTKQAIFESMASGSTGQTDLPRERLKGMNIIVPPSSVQLCFSKLVLPLKKQKTLLQEESVSLASLRNTLLPKLMSGEIEV